MDRIETIEWLANHCHTFPDFGSWIAGIQPLDKRSKLIDAWAEALSDVDPRDAKAVTNRMLSGDDPPIAAYEREQTPAKVRAMAKANRDRRAELDRQTIERQRGTQPSRRPVYDQSCQQLFRSILKTVDDNPGCNVTEEARKLLPAPSDDGPRYDCPLCRDYGLVTVWSEISIQAELLGELMHPGNRRTCVAPCTCDSGNRFVWSGQGDPPRGWAAWRSDEARYSPERHCLCRGADTTSIESISEFKQWVAAALDRNMNRNREPAFDQYNRGEF